jgi:hypothetical protein
MSYYVNQNADVFAMAVKEFGVRWDDIDYIDRAARIVWLHDGRGLDMPDDWIMS